VNEQWAGLGYYRRARYLLDGAKYVVDNFSGKLPTTADDLRKIPGVGPYTAAAVASIAFGQRSAVVDGNVVRVLCRLRTLNGDWSKRPLGRHIEGLAGQLLDPERPGDCNQALMELGAVQCLKAGVVPCGQCPIQSICLAKGAVCAKEL
jgi:A/G-specific adenine glycosylase